MLGHSHAMSGLAVGAATLPLAGAHLAVAGLPAQAAWVAAWGGMAMLPDLDQGGISWRGGGPKLTGSTVARLWGPITTAASLVGRLARGHRAGTHDPVVAPLAAYALTLAAVQWPSSTVLVVALALGLALQALHVVIPGRVEQTMIGNLAVSFAAAWLLVYRADVDLTWLPWAVAGGVLVHIAGDWLTVGGIPVPLTWLGGRPRRMAAGLFKTGAPIEHALAAVFALAAVALLVASTGLVPAAERAAAGVRESLAAPSGWWLPQ